MDIKSEDIIHLAKLSSFSLNSDEEVALAKDLNNIIRYISQLDELDTNNTEPTYQVFEMSNVWRDDEIKPQEAGREELLNLAKEVSNHQIKVPKVL